jgi:hypothetical protein
MLADAGLDGQGGTERDLIPPIRWGGNLQAQPEAEAVNSVIKRKFGDAIRSRCPFSRTVSRLSRGWSTISIASFVLAGLFIFATEQIIPFNWRRGCLRILSTQVGQPFRRATNPLRRYQVTRGGAPSPVAYPLLVASGNLPSPYLLPDTCQTRQYVV